MANLSRKKRAVFAILPVVIMLLLAECAVRITGAAETCPNHMSKHYWVCDPILQFRLRPDLVMKGDKLNSLGFRGAEFGEKREGTLQVLSLGDSCTLGVHAAVKFMEYPYPQRWQQLADSQLGKGKVEILNAGVAGYNSFHGILLLRTRLRDLEPDLITVRYGWNDHLFSDARIDPYREPESAPGLLWQDVLFHTKLYPFLLRMGMELKARRKGEYYHPLNAFRVHTEYAPTNSVEVNSYH